MPATAHICDRCGQTRVGRYFLLGGQICNTCYSSLRRHPAPCPSCGEIRVLAFITNDGEVVCASCVGQPSRFACSTCGSEQFLTGTHCGRCRLSQRLSELLRDEAGSVQPGLAHLHDYLTTAPIDPRTVVRWLGRETISGTLRGMATGRLPISHSSLDLLPPGPHTRYFRRLLIDAATLPAVPVLLHELNAFVDAVAPRLPIEHAPVLRRFHRWVMLPRLHSRYRDRGADITVGVFNAERSATLARATFVTWLSEQDIPLAHLDQPTLDHYISGIKSRVTVNQFVAWATRSHLAPDLEIHPQPTHARSTTYSEDQLWEHTRLLLQSDTIDLAVRVVGLFALVYAQPLDHSVRLTRDDARVQGEDITVAFGATPVRLAASIAGLLRQHLAAPPPRGFARGTSRWLFEGMMPGEHLSAAYIRLSLGRYGIRPRHARATRLDLLARQMPASVIADTIGITVHTAEQRSGRAGGTWSNYPALRPQ